MGDPKKRSKTYSKPRKSFQKERIAKEKEARKIYGLKNQREYLQAESSIRGKRANARKLLALELELRIIREKELIDSLKRIGILRGTPTLDDVLTLTPEALLERRLQTIVWRKGLANTVKQSRQFITHGHIAIDTKRVTIPSYIVTADDETKMTYYGKEMVLQEKKVKTKGLVEKKNQLKDDFEEAKPAEKKEDKAAEKKEVKPVEKKEIKIAEKKEVKAGVKGE